MAQFNATCRIGRNMMPGAALLLFPSLSGRAALVPAPAAPGVYGPFSATPADSAGLRKQFAASGAVPSSAHWTRCCRESRAM
jgi:hypothetical protein